MNHVDEQYLNLGRTILKEGTRKDDRTGTGTISITGAQMRFDLSQGFPLLTTKRVPFKLVASEKLWFIKGLTNIRYLLQYNNHIWNEWAFKKWVESDEYDGPDMTDFGNRSQIDEEFNKLYQEQMDIFVQRILEEDEFADKFGELGRVYGAQWRNAFYVNPDTLEVSTIDPLKMAIQQIKENPNSRRIIVSSWNPDNYMSDENGQPHAGLPCCHHQFQFIVNDDRLDLVFDMRSNDFFIGNPFNIAGYALLAHLVAHETGYKPGMLVYQGKDVHIYQNHVDQVNEQLSRKPKELPTLWLNPEKKSIFDFEVEDIKIIGYDPHPAIKAPVAV